MRKNRAVVSKKYGRLAARVPHKPIPPKTLWDIGTITGVDNELNLVRILPLGRKGDEDIRKQWWSCKLGDVVLYSDDGVTRVLARTIPQIEKVIINNPATIIYWEGGERTVVKCQDGDKFDAEKGVAMAIVKMIYGNAGNYNNIIHKSIEKEDS